MPPHAASTYIYRPPPFPHTTMSKTKEVYNARVTPILYAQCSGRNGVLLILLWRDFHRRPFTPGRV